MTREEQITFKAGSIADGCIAHGAPWKDYYQGFIEGAKWADANPYQPSLPSNLDDAAFAYGDRDGITAAQSYAMSIDFKAGAKWVAEQGYSQEEIVEDKSIEAGYGVLPGISPIINLPDSFKPGDKVIIQIRKKQ